MIIKILSYFLQVKISVNDVTNIKIKYICIKIFEKNCFFFFKLSLIFEIYS